MTVHVGREAIALFGSAARGDIDSYSDWDLLIVSDDEVLLRESKTKYEAEGWSCSAYTWSRLQDAADRGSLFVQHLKQESKVLWDPDDRLAQLFAEYMPKSSYRRQIDDTASWIGELMQRLPQGDAGQMWTLDVLSVGYRSLAVAYLADNGIYAFSSLGMVDGLMRLGVVDRANAPLLSSLRRYKSLYRNGKSNVRISWGIVFCHLKSLDKAFSLGLSSRLARDIDIVEAALNCPDLTQGHRDWYLASRRIESALLLLEPRQNNSALNFFASRRRLLKLVQAPQDYGWQLTKGRNSLQKQLYELACASAL